MTISPKTKWKIGRILPFGIIWLCFAFIFLFIEYAATDRFSFATEGVVKPNEAVLLFALIAITIIGLVVGTLDLFYLNKWFIKASFSQRIFGKTVFYILFLFFIISLTFPIATSIELSAPIFSKEVWLKYSDFLSSITFLSTCFQLGVSLMASLLYAEISGNIGHQVLLNFFSGKYHKPKEEVRIFMFLDMKNSTAIAEQLGHIQYFNFLKLYYQSISPPLINFSGELYQYVGDEMVVSWTLNNGKKNNNCLECFFAMKAALLKMESTFQETFGFTPTFKAAIHTGKTTIGEIGSIKKEILFSGDVLNTTARIQAQCNLLKAELLISEQLKIALPTNQRFHFLPKGETELKGKKETIKLFAVEAN